MNTQTLLYLWDRRSLFIGRLEEPLKLCQGAACLIVSLGKPFLYRSRHDEEFREAMSVLTPAGCDNEIDTRGELVANCMLDPFGEDYAMLSSVMIGTERSDTNSKIDTLPNSGTYFDGPQTVNYREGFREIFDNAMSYDAAYALLDKFLAKGVDPNLPSHPIDPRIIKVVDELKHRVHENLSIEDLAAMANVSVSRLVQLFKQQTGIPIRRYRCWHRLFVACMVMNKTGSLTEAAVIAGFADASHFTKTFHAMVGMCPSLLLSGPDKVKLLVA